MRLSLSLQRAILNTLRADTALTSMLDGPHIFDAPPHAETARLPHIVLGDESTRAWSTQDSSGADHEISISIWSDAKGYTEVKSAMEALYHALNNRPLQLEGGAVISLQFASARTSREAKGRLRRALCRFRVLVEHAEPG